MVQYYICKNGSDWKLAKAGTPDEAYQVAFRTRLNYCSYRVNPDELAVPVGTRKPEAQNRLQNLEKGDFQIAFCGCGSPYIADPKQNILKSCPADCGRTLRADGQPF